MSQVQRKRTTILATTAVVLMLGALAAPAYVVPWADAPDETYVYRGFEALLFGWAAVLSGISFAWLANPLWIWGVFRMVQGVAPNVWASLFGVAVSAFALQPFEAYRLDDTAGDVARPLIGATLFVASNAVVALTAVAGAIIKLRAGERARADASA